jgi:tRNA C32,U32 (ribose-2'-O)-methylase TrmJ
MSELDKLCIVLVATRNPLNLGAAARAMSNFGFSQLRVVAPYKASFREARSAVGASELLASAQEYASVAEAVADCALVVGTTAAHNRELAHRLFPLPQGAQLIREELRHPHQSQQRHCQGSLSGLGYTADTLSSGEVECRVALLFGSEKRGLSNSDLSHCHWMLHIPTGEEHVSMNLGQAVAVCLYELARDIGTHAPAPRQTQSQRLPAQGTPASPTTVPQSGMGTPQPGAAGPTASLTPSPASAADLERITIALLEALRISGYPHSHTAASEEKVRRLVHRFGLNTSDAETLLGMLRQILWKINAGK